MKTKRLPCPFGCTLMHLPCDQVVHEAPCPWAPRQMWMFGLGGYRGYHLKALCRAMMAIMPICFLSACAHMHIVCQDAGMTSLAVGGNTAGQQILSLGLAVAGTAASGAKLMAMAPPSKDTAPTAQSQSYVDYTYMPIFGADFASCSALPPPLPPTTSIMLLTSDGRVQVVPTDSHQIVVAPVTK